MVPHRHGRPLSEQELEYAVLTVEAAEECMVHSKVGVSEGALHPPAG